MNTMNYMNARALELTTATKTALDRAVSLSHLILQLSDKLLLCYHEDNDFSESSEVVITIGEIRTYHAWRSEEWVKVQACRKAYAKNLLRILELRELEQQFAE